MFQEQAASVFQCVGPLQVILFIEESTSGWHGKQEDGPPAQTHIKGKQVRIRVYDQDSKTCLYHCNVDSLCDVCVQACKKR